MAGKHPRNALNAQKVRALNEPGRYADGNGLYLVVTPTGGKQWVLRTVVQGRRRDIGVGSLRLVSLAEARDIAHSMRKIARDGGDPIAERRKATQVIPTFAEAAKTVHADYSRTWKNKKHAAQWITTLERYAFPVIGERPVNQIESVDVLRVLSPIWTTKPETARRVRQRIGTVLDWAHASNYREAGNPTASITKGLPKQVDQPNHFTAMPYAQVPAFIERLNAHQGADVTRLAIEFTILTASRTSEVIGARLDEIDSNEGVWVIPGDRMKARKEHRVPLCERALTIVDMAHQFDATSPFVFPGRSAGKPMSNMAMLNFVKKSMKEPITMHGFRSAFRDWASERTSFPHEVCEMALAHTIKNKAEAAYRRGDLLSKRRQLMEAWAQFVLGGSAEIVSLRTDGAKQ